MVENDNVLKYLVNTFKSAADDSGRHSAACAIYFTIASEHGDEKAATTVRTLIGHQPILDQQQQKQKNNGLLHRSM